MTTTMTATDAVAEYLERLEDLYCQVREWLEAEEPTPTFRLSDVALNEELVGRYKAKRLEVTRSDGLKVTFLPKGLCVVGARGRVDVAGPLGPEILVWVEEGGPALGFREGDEGSIEMVSGRPMYPGLAEGWAWVDNAGTRLRHFDRDVFLERVVRSLSE